MSKPGVEFIVHAGAGMLVACDRYCPAPLQWMHPHELKHVGAGQTRVKAGVHDSASSNVFKPETMSNLMRDQRLLRFSVESIEVRAYERDPAGVANREICVASSPRMPIHGGPVLDHDCWHHERADRQPERQSEGKQCLHHLNVGPFGSPRQGCKYIRSGLHE